MKLFSWIPLQNSNVNMLHKMYKTFPRSLPFLIVAFLLILVYAFFHSKEGFQCKPDELDTFIQSPEPTMVLFYADWCGHCTKLKPVWEEAATKANADTTRMIKIDVGGKNPEHKEVMKKYQIDGFPTILVFENGTPTPYKGDRSVDSFLQTVTLRS